VDTFYLAGAVIVLVLGAAGLFAAMFHLGHPLRAWRAVAMWRTSWLSREVIVLPVFMLVVALWGGAHRVGAPSLVLGGVACALALVLYLCTGMIYAAVSAIREWATPLTPLNFALIGIASGLMLVSTLAAFAAPQVETPLVVSAIGATLIAALSRAFTFWRNQRLVARTTLQSAIGIRHPQIRQISQGAMGGSFNTREFFHAKPAAFVVRTRWCAALLGFAIPVGLAGVVGAWGLLLLFLAQLAGLIAERWLFFADARHPQNLYYQSMA
jgi:DMSO reductase anchor subunit